MEVEKQIGAWVWNRPTQTPSTMLHDAQGQSNDKLKENSQGPGALF